MNEWNTNELGILTMSLPEPNKKNNGIIPSNLEWTTSTKCHSPNIYHHQQLGMPKCQCHQQWPYHIQCPQILE